MAKDDLDAFIEERTKKNPRFPKMISAAEQRQAIARKLVELRKQRASQTEIAAAMGTSASIISRLERGADVRLSTLQKYAAALDLELQVSLVESESPRKQRRAS